MYTGMADAVVPPQDTFDYYAGVAKMMGGVTETRTFFRFFPVPGMGHCGGGEGPNEFDGLAALEAWVERGIAPGSIKAVQRTSGRVERSRPLCAYPSWPRYKGVGSVNDAANFSCVVATASAARK